MQKAIISVVFHSYHGHTERAAILLTSFLQSGYNTVHFINVIDMESRWGDLHESDVILFGCPTIFGNVSAPFKAFLETTSNFLYRQLWKNKFSAAFTVSPTSGGDKQHTLQSIAVFAAHHSMNWISPGVLPRFCNGQQTDGQNRFSGYLGLMIQSDSRNDRVEDFHSGDVLTIELFASRILDVTPGYSIKINNYETIRN